MHDVIAEAPTGTAMVLRALARFPERLAFVRDGGSLTYRAALASIGRLQAAMATAGRRKGQTVGFPSVNNAETWCAGVAAGATLATSPAPRQIEFVDSLPLTAVGKVDKKVLRTRYWAGQVRQVG